jgi:hypothetical protein
MMISDDKLALAPASPLPPGPNWRNDDVPDDGAVVEVCAQDRRGFYKIPFPVRFQDDEWLNHQTGEVLDTFVAGWRERADG